MLVTLTQGPTGTKTVGTFLDITSHLWDPMTQGTGQGQRIGNKIQPISMSFEGFINWDNTDNTNQLEPIVLKMIVFKFKNSNTPGNSSMSMEDWFQFGDTAVAPQNNLFDIYQRINKDEYTVYATRTFKIGEQFFKQQGSNPNNGFSPIKRFKVDLSKYIKKTLIYDDNENVVKNSRMLVLFVGGTYNNTPFVAPPTGGDPNSASCRISYVLNGSYKDL